MNACFASVAVDFLRRKLFGQPEETVMSQTGKVETVRTARKIGYRTYLYYVATDHPTINISRGANRVALGGHSVPENKIVERHHRSLDPLLNAIRQTRRAYIFDTPSIMRMARIHGQRKLPMAAHLN